MTNTKRSMVMILLLALLAVSARAEIVDRIVAVAGNRVITWSDVVAEARYQAFVAGREQPATEELAKPEVMEPILTKLIDQRLLEQDRDSLPFEPPDQRETESRLDAARLGFPSMDDYRQALSRAGLTEEALAERLERETNLMSFIDRRLRPQVRVDPADTELYYRETLEPELRRGGQTEIPPLVEVREQIEQVLAAQQTNDRLEQLLRDLRARMGVRIVPASAATK
jgi:hypothetical protein